MVRGHVTKEPKKPFFVDKQKMVYNWGIAKFIVYLLKGKTDEPLCEDNPYIVRLHFSYLMDKKKKKWDNRSINIKCAEDWETIKNIIDGDFAADLGWISKKEALKKLEEKPTMDTVKEILEKRPTITLDFLEVTDVSKMEVNAIQRFAEKLLKKNKEVIGKYMQVFNSLLGIQKKDEQYIMKLDDIIQKISLYGITSTMNHVMYRLTKINIFEKMVMDDSTYERKGEDSIHRFLERDIWILGEEYQILKSDRPLRESIQNRFVKKYKKYGKLRPDFVCSRYENMAVIVEIKRPSHELTIDDLNKIEFYREIAGEYSGTFKDSNCYLIVKSIPPDLEDIVYKREKIDVHVKTYNDAINEVRTRYLKLLEILESELKETESSEDDDYNSTTGQ